MKRCPHCNALNSESGTFCWRCYKRLYREDADGYVSLRRRIKERIRDVIQYRDIRELLKEKIRIMTEREERGEL
jgi:hypothetical protein